MVTPEPQLSDGLLEHLHKRLRALWKKSIRITQMEDLCAEGKPLNPDQEKTLLSKPVVLALIQELEKLSPFVVPKDVSGSSAAPVSASMVFTEQTLQDVRAASVDTAHTEPVKESMIALMPEPQVLVRSASAEEKKSNHQSILTVSTERDKRTTPDWSNLAIEVWSIILHKLPLEDHIRCASVCSDWLSIIYPLKYCSSHPRVPWLMIPHYVDQTKWTFCDMADKKLKGTIKLSELQSGGILGSSDGWIVYADWKTGNLQLLNPFTREHIQLPPTLAFPGITGAKYDFQGNVREYKVIGANNQVTPADICYNYFEKAVMGPSNCGYTIVVAANNGMNMAFARIGDKSWTTLQTPELYEWNCTFFKGVFYVTDIDNGVLCLDLNNKHESPLPFLQVAPPLPVLYEQNQLILLPESGDMLVSCRTSNVELDDMSVFKLDKEACKWVATKLNDHSLFLIYRSGFGCPHTVMCLPMKDYPAKHKGNYIYEINGRSLKVWDNEYWNNGQNCYKSFEVWDMTPNPSEKKTKAAEIVKADMSKIVFGSTLS